MLAAKFLWALLCAAALALTLLTGSVAAAALTLALLLLPLLALGCDLAAARRVRCTISAPVNLQKNAQGTLRLTLQNGSVLPVSRAVCRVEVQNLLTGETALLRAECGLLPRRERTVELMLCAEHSGRLQVRVERVRLYDAFGLIGVRALAGASAGVTVQPDIFAQTLIISPADAPNLDAEQYAPDRPGSDLTEPYQIRDYVPGDSRRQILWKLSGKYDRLLVKDASLPVQQDILVFWERMQTAPDAVRTDVQAEVLVTLCRSLLSQGAPFTLAWNEAGGARCVSFVLRELDDLIGVLPRLLSAAAVTGAPGYTLLAQAEELPAAAHLVYITNDTAPDTAARTALRRFGTLRILYCGDEPTPDGVHFDAVQYARQLETLTI